MGLWLWYSVLTLVVTPALGFLYLDCPHRLRCFCYFKIGRLNIDRMW